MNSQNIWTVAAWMIALKAAGALVFATLLLDLKALADPNAEAWDWRKRGVKYLSAFSGGLYAGLFIVSTSGQTLIQSQ